jgi:hypothetical protein
MVFEQWEKIRDGQSPYDCGRYENMTRRERFKVVFCKVAALTDDEIEGKS